MKVLFLVFLSLSLAYSGSISGQIFEGDDFTLLSNTRITIENNAGLTISQGVFTKEYSMDLENGDYTLRAYHYSEGKLDYYIEQKVQIKDGENKLDLVLLPYDLYLLVPESKPPPLADSSVGTDGQIPVGKPFDYLILFAGLAALLAVAYLVYKFLGQKKPEEKTSPEEAEPYELDEDGKKVLKILHEQEGRIMQKELREILQFSEAKLSLLLSELEVNGYIKRIKKGRDNIVKLVKSATESDQN